MGRLERLNNTVLQRTMGPKGLIYMVPAVGIEPTRPQGTRDFESRASTSSTTPAHCHEFLKEQENFKNYKERLNPCQEKMIDSRPNFLIF